MAQFDVHRDAGRLGETVPLDQLGERVGSLAEHGDSIMAALDEVLTRAWD
mgnify:CR=1 FL=1